jgi:hypothetical protein
VACQCEIDPVAGNAADQDLVTSIVVPRPRHAMEMQDVVFDYVVGIGPQNPFKFKRFGHRAGLLPIGMPVELSASPLRRI